MTEAPSDPLASGLVDGVDFSALSPDLLAQTALRRRAEASLAGADGAEGVRAALVDLTMRVMLLEQALASRGRTPEAVAALDPLGVPDAGEVEAARLAPLERLSLGAEALQFGTGWYKQEMRSKGAFRWSGPGARATVLAPLIGARAGLLELALFTPGRRPLASLGLSFHMDGTPLAAEPFDPEASQAVVRLPFTLAAPVLDLASLEIGVENLATPVQWKPDSKDTRMLGVGLAGLVVVRTA